MTRFGNSSVEKNSSTGNAGSMTVRDSYFYEPRFWQLADHIDAIQSDGGVQNVTISRNTVFVEPYGYTDYDTTTAGNVATSCLNLTAQIGNYNGDVMIDHNYIAGGGACVYCSTQGKLFLGNVTITANVFDRAHFGTVTQKAAVYFTLYPTNTAPQLVWTHNRWEDGSPLSYAQAIS
jgi:hypothetical protein